MFGRRIARRRFENVYLVPSMIVMVRLRRMQRRSKVFERLFLNAVLKVVFSVIRVVTVQLLPVRVPGVMDEVFPLLGESSDKTSFEMDWRRVRTD